MDINLTVLALAIIAVVGVACFWWKVLIEPDRQYKRENRFLEELFNTPITEDTPND